MNKPHKHAEVIKAWADGAEIQCSATGIIWTDIPEPLWDDHLKYRIKPPAPKWPETTLSQQAIKRAFHAANGETHKGWRGIANAAIAHALETGQVVLP